MDQVHLKWFGPFDWRENWLEGRKYDWGIYMITRKWGSSKESILYIGQAYKGDFSTRLSKHWRDWGGDRRGNLSVRLSELLVDQGKRLTKRKVTDAEALLIYKYQPPWNKDYKKEYFRQDCRVLSTGQKGPLASRITSTSLR